MNSSLFFFYRNIKASKLNKLYCSELRNWGETLRKCHSQNLFCWESRPLWQANLLFGSPLDHSKWPKFIREIKFVGAYLFDGVCLFFFMLFMLLYATVVEAVDQTYVGKSLHQDHGGDNAIGLDQSFASGFLL